MTTAIARGLVPTLRPADISWRSVGPFLEVQLILTNESGEPTEAAELVIEAAPFGAFVPFEPVTRLAVTAFEPFERRRVIAMIPRGRLDSASGFPRQRTGDPALDNAMDEFRLFRELIETAHWAGNLNVWFDRAPERAVEVHRAHDLEVEAGRDVFFAFALAPGQEYDMEARASDPAWKAAVRPPGWSYGFLLVTPPALPKLGATVEVRVTRVLDGKTVPVTFGLKTVEGRGGSLGCIRA